MKTCLIHSAYGRYVKSHYHVHNKGLRFVYGFNRKFTYKCRVTFSLPCVVHCLLLFKQSSSKINCSSCPSSARTHYTFRSLPVQKNFRNCISFLHVFMVGVHQKTQIIYGNSLKTLKVNYESFTLYASKACEGVEIWLRLVLTWGIVSTMKATIRVYYYCFMVHQTCSVEGRLKITKKIFQATTRPMKSHLLTYLLIYLLYAFSWVIPRRLNFICRRFGTLCLFHIYRRIGMKNDQV